MWIIFLWTTFAKVPRKMPCSKLILFHITVVDKKVLAYQEKKRVFHITFLYDCYYYLKYLFLYLYFYSFTEMRFCYAFYL